MAVTPNYSIPYPALTDAPNGPAQMQALATAVDTNVAAALAAIDPRGTYSRYQGAGTATGSGVWTALPFVTLVDGAGTGLSVAASTTWTLTKAGVWTVDFFGVLDASGAHPGVTGGIFGLATSTAFTSLFSESQSSVVASQVAGTTTAEILTTGTTTVVAGVFTAGAASAMATGGILPRLSFKWSPN